MHGQGSYSEGQGPYAPPPSYQQHSVVSPALPPPPPLPSPPPPPPFYHDSLLPQPQARPSFQHAPVSLPYPQALPGVPQQGPQLSSGINSGQSYLTHPRPPQVHGSTQISHAFPTSEHQNLSWSQNLHQFPPRAPLPAQTAYPLLSSHMYNMERGPAHQTPSQLPPPPPLPTHSSSSTFSTPDPYGSLNSAPQYTHPFGQLPPPPPPRPPPSPPPLPPSSPGVPPLPPASSPSDNLSKNDGTHSLNDLSYEKSLVLDHPPRVRLAEESNEVLCQTPAKNGPDMKAADAVSAHSPADSDMDMEDDITQPDEEKQSGLSDNLNDGCIYISQELHAKEPLQSSQHTGEHIVPKVDVDGQITFVGSSVSKDQLVGPEVPSDFDIAVSSKSCSEADDLGMTGNGETEHPMDISIKNSPSQHEDLTQPSSPVTAAEVDYEKLPNQLTEGANSFKLLQGYDSDNSKENEGDNLHGYVSPPFFKVESTNFDARISLENLPESNKLTVPKSMIESPRNVMEADEVSIAIGKVEEIVDKSHIHQEFVCDGQPKDSMRKNADTGLKGDNAHKRHEKKVDEFGRLVRDGVSDSDSSDSPRYARKHARRDRKRSRSQSRSRSPHDRRRRRRSRWRRKERRGQSRSLSPKRRRSKSRSPVRRGSEFVGDKLRWEKGKVPQCFDFLRGKCYRGANCRYSHHESDKSQKVRYRRDKQQYQDMAPTLGNPDVHEEGNVLPFNNSVQENKEMEGKGLKLPKDFPSLKEVNDAKEPTADPSTDSLQVSDIIPSNLSVYSSHDMPIGNDNSLVQESPAQYSDKVHQIDPQCKRVDDSVISESSSSVQESETTLTHLTGVKPDAEPGPTGKPWSDGISLTKSLTTEEIPSQFHHPLPPVSRVMSSPVAQQIPGAYNSMPPVAQFHYKPQNYSPYQAPVPYQHSHFHEPSNYSSSSFLPPPPPPPLPHTHLTAHITSRDHNIPSVHIQQSYLHPQNDVSSYTSIRPYPTEFPRQPETAQYHAYPYVQNPDQISHTTDDFRSRSLHMNNVTSDRGTGHPDQGINHLQSVGQSQPDSLQMQSASQGMHASHGGDVPANTSSSYNFPNSEQASYGQQFVANDVSSQLSEPGKVSSSMSRNAGDFIEMNPHSRLPDFVGSRISNHFNPYASTFDQPLSIKFSSNADTQFNTKYGASFGLSSVPVDVHKIESVSSKNMISSLSSAWAAESVLPRPSGDQYDPLFDSIDPASDSFSRADRQNETIADSDNFTGLSGSSKVLIRGNINQQGSVAVSANNSLEIEEYGETADAEVGDVVNGSPSNSNDAATDLNEGEIEIDKSRASGKKKKVKDSKSSKLFKISIAAFVKEVLKPSWRQGNMSKEAFKTIVKKTVDKVSGAMKGHQIPKSQTKINHYIDSSRGKLTKLVMGYVDKYVKM